MNEFSSLFSQLPIAGAMIWFAYYVVSESRKERQSWSEERKEMYTKISESLIGLTSSIDKMNDYVSNNTKALEKLLDKE